LDLSASETARDIGIWSVVEQCGIRPGKLPYRRKVYDRTIHAVVSIVSAAIRHSAANAPSTSGTPSPHMPAAPRIVPMTPAKLPPASSVALATAAR
jgi:hypothetical protein